MIGAVGALLMTTALLACLVPTVRVTGLSPAVVLRND
jgi:ABC-type lipoprotein release transport system permease subunit